MKLQLTSRERSEAGPYMHLWVAVLEQAVKDATFYIETTPELSNAIEALDWIERNAQSVVEMMGALHDTISAKRYEEWLEAKRIECRENISRGVINVNRSREYWKQKNAERARARAEARAIKAAHSKRAKPKTKPKQKGK